MVRQIEVIDADPLDVFHTYIARIMMRDYDDFVNFFQ
mgnify:CR=1 FL=1